MGNEILTALGLDLSQYETGVNKAAQVTNLLSHAIDAVDGGLRKIPVVGAAYSATLGHIIDGFAQATLNAREFARIMQTDVSGSLRGSVVHVEEINAQIKKLADAPIQNRVTAFLGGLFKGKKGDVFGGIEELFTGKKQEEAILALDRRREEILENISELRRRETQALSEAYSKSKLATDLSRINLTLGERNIEAQKIAFALGGPDKAKWTEQVRHGLEEQLALNESIATQERAAAVARNQVLLADLKSRAAIASLQANSNQRQIAEEELRIAKEKAAINQASGAATNEQIEKDKTDIKIAEQGVAIAKRNYDLEVKQADLHNRAIELEIHGQTRAATQARIREQFEIRITEAKRRGNVELATQLEREKKSAQLQEAIRQYKLGAGGRAAERQRERTEARISRTVEAQLRTREQGQLDAAGGLHSGGLITGGLRSGGLGGRMLITKPAAKKPEPVNFQAFTERLFRLLEK